MPRRLRRSLLAHLSAAFAVGFLLLVGALALVLDRGMMRTVHAQVDKDLLDAAHVTLHRLDEDHYPIDKELLDLGDSLYLRLTDREDRLLIESRHIERLQIEKGPAPPLAWSWRERLASTSLPIKWLSVPWSGGWIRVYRDMHHEAKVLEQFRTSTISAMGLLSLLAGALGYLLVKLGLRPLQSLAQDAAAVGPESLGRRIDPTPLPRELDAICLELNRTFDRLEDGYRRLSALNADLAHEMRTPLHSMKLELERLLEAPELPPVHQDAIAELAETAGHLAALLEQMLFLARVEDPSQHVQRLPVDVVRLLERVRTPFLALAEERGVRLTIRLAGMPRLTGDPTLIRRALHNLLSNALRHSPDGGEILLEARGAPKGTTFEVLDQGPGMPDQVKRNIGQRFLRAESAGPGGSGLGLAIVRGIADLHDASLSFEDAEPTGCRASITFPPT